MLQKSSLAERVSEESPRHSNVSVHGEPRIKTGVSEYDDPKRAEYIDQIWARIKSRGARQ